MLAQYVILGLLKERPMHGYEIKQRFEQISGLFWKVSYGSLYPALRKLSEEGLIDQQEACGDHAGRKVFYLSHSGTEALLQWLREAGNTTDMSRNSRNEFMLRLTFFSYLAKDEARALIQKRRDQLVVRLNELTKKAAEINQKDEPGDYYKLAMLEYIIRSIETEKAWLEDILAGEKMPMVEASR